MPWRRINLTEQDDEFVQQQVKTSRFCNASEVMRAGLELLQQQSRTERQRIKLRALAVESFGQLDHGAGITLNGERMLAAHIRRLGKRAARDNLRKAQ